MIKCLDNRNNVFNEKQNKFITCLVLTNASKMERRWNELEFHDLCEEGDVESVKTLLDEDPSLVNSKDPEYGKF